MQQPVAPFPPFLPPSPCSLCPLPPAAYPCCSTAGSIPTLAWGMEHVLPSAPAQSCSSNSSLAAPVPTLGPGQSFCHHCHQTTRAPCPRLEQGQSLQCRRKGKQVWGRDGAEAEGVGRGNGGTDSRGKGVGVKLPSPIGSLACPPTASLPFDSISLMHSKHLT